MKTPMSISISRFSIVVAVLMLFACGESMTEAQMIASAKAYMQKNQINNAAIELKNTLQANPSNAEARYLLAEMNMIVGDYASAEKDFQRASELGWNVAESKVGELRAQVELRKFKEVTSVLVDANVWSVAAQANVLALKAISYASLGDMTQAESTLVFAQNLDANAYSVLKVAAQLQLLGKKADEVEVTLARAFELYPDDAAFLLLRANLEILQGQTKKALATYQQIIDEDEKKFLTPVTRAAHIGAMKLAVLTKDYALIEQSRKALLKKNKKDYEAFYYLAVSAFEQKHYEEADEYLKKILKQSSSHAPTLLLAGAVNFTMQHFEQAAYYLNKYLTIDPDSIKARKLLGRTYMALGQYDDASSAFRSALKQKSDDAELIALMGLSEINDGQVQLGIQELEKAISLAPDSSSLRQELAKAYIAKGQTDDAIKQLDEVLQGGDENYQARYMKVLAYIRDKNYDKAIEVTQLMLGELPDNPDVFNLMGTVQAISGDAVQARTYFNRALSIKEGYKKAILSLARLDESEGAFASAKDRYLLLLEKTPKDTEAMVSLARLALQNGDVKEQVKWLQAAREANKGHLFSRIALVEISLNKGELSEVETLINELEDVGARNPAVLAVKSRLLMAQKRYVQAESILNEFIRARPEQDVGYYLQAQTQLFLGRQADALLNLRTAYKLNSAALRNSLLLARVELASGNAERALELADEVINVVPDSAVGYVIKGKALNDKKDYQEALLAYDKAWTYSPTREVLLYRFAAMRRSSDKEGANQLLLDWLEVNPDDAAVALELGSVYDVDKNFDGAIKYYEIALKGLPGKVSVLNNLAWLYRDDKKVRALELAEKAHQLDSDSAGVKDTYGWILLNKANVTKEETRQASGLLKQAMIELSSVPEVRYHYAVSLIKIGRVDEGKQLLKELLDSGKSFIGKDGAKKMMR